MELNKADKINLMRLAVEVTRGKTIDKVIEAYRELVKEVTTKAEPRR